MEFNRNTIGIQKECQRNTKEHQGIPKEYQRNDKGTPKAPRTFGTYLVRPGRPWLAKAGEGWRRLAKVGEGRGRSARWQPNRGHGLGPKYAPSVLAGPGGRSW